MTGQLRNIPPMGGLPALDDAGRQHQRARADMLVIVYEWSRDEARLPGETWRDWEARIDLLRSQQMAIWDQAYPAPPGFRTGRTLAEMKAAQADSPWKRNWYSR